MGVRNSSKVAQRFANEWLEAFSKQLDTYVEMEWLPKQSAPLQALLAERAAKLGPAEARPFATDGYTDDFKIDFVSGELAAAGARIWRQMNKKANFWLSPKCGAGTVIDFIGGRQVLNGGFGCLSANKRARAIHGTRAAIEQRITREQLVSHNSYLAHADAWLAFPPGTLKGLSAPLRGSTLRDDQVVGMQPATVQRFERVAELLQTRAAASYWSGIDEAAEAQKLMDAADGRLIFAPRLGSDACSDVEHPAICGGAAGLYFIFPLVGEWRNRHITLTEACGTVITLQRGDGALEPHHERENARSEHGHLGRTRRHPQALEAQRPARRAHLHHPRPAGATPPPGGRRATRARACARGPACSPTPSTPPRRARTQPAAAAAAAAAARGGHSAAHRTSNLEPRR